MDRRTTPRPTTVELLAQAPLLSGLSSRELGGVSALTTRLELPAGRELTRQGSLGREFVVLFGGEVGVVKDDRPIGTLGAGEVFGEIALLQDRPRTATVVSTTAVSVGVIARPDFAILVQDHPTVAEELQAKMAGHLARDEARSA
jgi:CRP-like cAMP-binding protein